MKIYRPGSISEALKFLVANGTRACLLAGGTDLAVDFKNGSLNLEACCDISGLDELRFITEYQDTIAIGPLTTHQEIVESALLNKQAPLLAQASATVGSLQIRNRGTIGGNIGTASPAGDTLPALLVLGAQLKVSNCDGERFIKSREFFRGPKKTVLKPGEIITEISFPKLKEGERGFYSKLGARNALAISIVGVAAKLKVTRGIFEKVEVALGSVAPTVHYQRLAYLEGEDLAKRELWNRLQQIKDEVSPITDMRATSHYRKEMAVALLFQELRESF